MKPRFVALGAVALSLLGGGIAFAQTPAPAPTPVSVPTLPPQKPLDPYARAAIDIVTGIVNRQISNLQNSATGQVTYFRRFDMQISGGRNSYQTVHLHQGTVINPTGTTIVPGMQVQVGGRRQADGSLDADVITVDR